MPKQPTIAQIRKQALLKVPVLCVLALALCYGLVLLFGFRHLRWVDASGFEEAGAEAGAVIQHALRDASSRLRDVASSEQLRRDMGDALPLVSIRNQTGGFREVSAYDTFGALLGSSEKTPTEIHAFPELFEAALRGETAVSQPLAEGDGPPVVVLLVPILDELGQAQSLLAGVLPLDDVWAGLDEVSLRNGAAFALLDAFDRLVGMSGMPAAAALLPEPTQAASERQGVTEDRRFFYAATTLEHAAGLAGPDWTVLSLRPYSAMGSVLARYTTAHAAAGVLAVLCMAGVGLALVQRIYDPLQRAVEAAEKVDRGQLDVQVPGDGPAELAAIASALNHMTAEVRYHRHTMTSMVEARTRSLERAQKAQERIMEQLKASYESTDEGFLVMDVLTGEILQFNKRVCLLFGLVEEDLRALSVDGFRETLKTMFCEPIDFENRWNYYNENPGEEGREEWQLKRPHSMMLSVYTAPVKSEPQNVIMARLWMFRDVTEARSREEQLRQAQQMEAMAQIAGSVAHDFNNLLTVMIGNLSLAQMECEEDAPLLEYLNAAQQATGEASGLIKQLLGFSNRTRMQLACTDLNSIVTRVHQSMRPSVHHGVRMHVELDESLWDAQADASQMHQVFTSLLMERVDMLPAGGEVWIRSENVLLVREDARLPEERGPGEYVRMMFSTQEPGGLDAGSENAFEPLRDNMRGRAGLGLCMAQGILVRHGGWLAAVEQASKRMAFAVYVPRTEQRSTAMTTDPRTDNAGSAEGAVLIVDDESGVRRIAVSVLKRAGLATREAGDGEEAIRIYQEEGSAIGVVLLDLSMPKLSGRETFKALKLMNPMLPILLCSGYPVAPEDFERETGHRPDGIVQKPFDIRLLPDEVRSVMQPALAIEQAG